MLVIRFFTVTLAAAVIAASTVSCKKAEGTPGPAAARDDAVPVTVDKVTLVPFDRTLPVVGTLYAKDEATIGAEVEGQLEKTTVDFGDRLKADQEIALIDTATYEAQARQAEASLARARATAINAEKELKRQKSLGAIASQADLDKADAEAEQARAEVKAAEATDAIAKLNLRRSHVRAPFDAAVAERVVSAGDFVKVGAPLFRIVDDRVLKFIVQAPERYAADVRKGMPVVFTVDAYPGEKFEGRVYLISPQVSTATRSFAFGALVTNLNTRLRANTFARGELIIERAVPTPVVPLDAVVNFAGVTKVFVIEGDVARGREVTVGRIVNGRQEVLGGLKPSDVVILSGQTKLYDGTRVRVKEAAAPAAVAAAPHDT